MAFKDADSAELLEEIWQKVEADGFRLGNLDATIIAEKPKMAPYVEQMKLRIAELLHADSAQVNVKATTTEKLGLLVGKKASQV